MAIVAANPMGTAKAIITQMFLNLANFLPRSVKMLSVTIGPHCWIFPAASFFLAGPTLAHASIPKIRIAIIAVTVAKMTELSNAARITFKMTHARSALGLATG